MRKDIIRYGIQGLYAYTPFKLLGSKSNRYSIILPSKTAHHTVQGDVHWHSASFIDRFKVVEHRRSSKQRNQLVSINKTVILPYYLISTEFSPNSNKSVKYTPKNQKSDFSYYPVYAEFSYDALKGGYYCKRGYVLLSNDSSCPIRLRCPIFTPVNNNNNNCIYYGGPIAYSSLYNVYPIIIRQYEEYNESDNVERLAAVRYKNSLLFTVNFIHRGALIAYISAVQFNPKGAHLFYDAPKTIYLNNPLGYRIKNVPSIMLEFDTNTFRQMIINILNTHRQTAQWLKLKETLYLKDIQFDYLPNKRGFKAFKNFVDVLEGNLNSIINDVNHVNPKNDPDLIDFASFVLVHSLAHSLMNWIGAKYGYTKENLGYYILHYKLPETTENKIKLYIFEEAVGGLGYLREFADDLKKNSKDTLKDLFSDILSPLCGCFKRSSNQLKNLEANLDKYNRDLAKIIVSIYNSKLNKLPNGIYPHVNTVREIISYKSKQSPQLQQYRDVLDNMLTWVPHCWDGCQLCVAIEKGCMYDPYSQFFLVSNSLLRDAINGGCDSSSAEDSILYWIQNPIYEEYNTIVGKDTFEKFVSYAINKIYLISPWISESVASILSKTAEKGIEVKIITTNDKNNIKALEILKNSNVEVRLYSDVNNLHAKGMMIDEIILMTGSFNFTESGLNSNRENLIINFDRGEVERFTKSFNELWQNAQSYK